MTSATVFVTIVTVPKKTWLNAITVAIWLGISTAFLVVTDAHDSTDKNQNVSHIVMTTEAIQKVSRVVMTTITTNVNLSWNPQDFSTQQIYTKGNGTDTTAFTTQNTVTPTSRQISYNTAEFEILLPIIFGLFVVLSLSLMMFYSGKDKSFALTDDKKELYQNNSAISVRTELYGQRDRRDSRFLTLVSSGEKHPNGNFTYSPGPPS